MYTTLSVCKEPFININRTHLCLMDTPFFFLQESSFLYSPSEAQIKDKEVNHDILWREGKTFKVYNSNCLIYISSLLQVVSYQSL